MRRVERREPHARQRIGAAVLAREGALAPGIGQRDLRGPARAVAQIGDLDLVARTAQADLLAQVGRALDRVAIHRHDHVACGQTGAVRGRPRLDRADDGAGLGLDVQRLGKIGRQILDRHPEPAAPHLAEFDELVHDGERHVDGHGEADPDVAAAPRRDDRGVDADELAVERDQRAARIAGVDRGVGLDEVLVAFRVDPRPPERRDDAARHGLAEAEGIADGDDEIAHQQFLGIAKGHLGQVLGVDPEHRDVGGRIAADQLGLEAPVVAKGDADLVGILDHVAVGQHEAVPGIDDDARARAHLALRRQAPGRRQERLEERVAEERRHLRRTFRDHGDVDHRVVHGLDQRRDGRDAAGIGPGRRDLGRRRVRGDAERQDGKQGQASEHVSFPSQKGAAGAVPGGAVPSPQPPLTSMRRTRACASGVRGRLIVSTPFRKLASALSPSTPGGSGIVR